MTRTKIGYFRVSREDETEQDLDHQIHAVLDKFNLQEDDLIIYKERGSAYDLDKIGKRKEFLALLCALFDVEKTTISDLFLSNHKKKEIDLYIWDYSRIMRNMEFCLLFGLLCDWFDVRIISHKQGLIGKKDVETPNDKLVKYLMYSINSYSGEEYSYNISKNVQKAVRVEDNVTSSYKGNKWGKNFRSAVGEAMELSPDQVVELNVLLVKSYKKHTKQGVWGSYERIIADISKKFGVSISKAYINKIKNNNNL